MYLSLPQHAQNLTLRISQQTVLTPFPVQVFTCNQTWLRNNARSLVAAICSPRNQRCIDRFGYHFLSMALPFRMMNFRPHFSQV